MSAPLKKYIVTRERCPACESVRSETLYRASYTEPPIRDYLTYYYSEVGKGVELEYLEGSEYILDECKDCGLIYQREVLNAFALKKLYEQWLDPALVQEGESRERTARYYLWCAAQTARIIEYLKKLPSGLKFLDFGMGRGNWCLIARGFGCDVYAMEISHAWLDHADALGVKLLSWEELAHHKFDFINAEQVFEHLADPLETLTRLRQALSTDGIIRISVPGRRDIKRKLQKPDWSMPDGSPGSLNAVAPLQHLNCFNFEALIRMGRKAGLEEVEVPDEFLQPEGITAKVKAILRPLYLKLFPGIHEARRRQVPNLCFRLATPGERR